MADTKKKHFGKDLSFASTEAYNLLRTNIQFTLPGENGRGQIIGITSSGPSEGKTYTTVNLACSIAHLEKKVVIIDGDMRKPTVARYFNTENKKGLSNVLVNPKLNVIQPSGVENLDCVSSGTIPPNPSELIGSATMKEYLLKLTEKYDYVFVDLPPIGVVSDALAVSPFLDGIIVVVRHGVTRPRDLRETISRLELAKANILGFVYNAFFHRHVSPYYYRSKNKYKYYYSHYAKKDKEKKEDKK